MSYYLAIDAGTSVIKTIIFNSNFKQNFSLSIKNPIIIDDHGKSELDMNLFWNLTSKCIKQAIIKSKIKKSEIIGIGITGNMVLQSIKIYRLNAFYGMTGSSVCLKIKIF